MHYMHYAMHYYALGLCNTLRKYNRHAQKHTDTHSGIVMTFRTPILPTLLDFAMPLDTHKIYIISLTK